jgi:hypothetical protein
MENKNWNFNLILGVVFTSVFFWLLQESEPIKIYQVPIDIQIVRMLCLLIAIINFASYLSLKK